MFHRFHLKTVKTYFSMASERETHFLFARCNTGDIKRSRCSQMNRTMYDGNGEMCIYSNIHKYYCCMVDP